MRKCRHTGLRYNVLGISMNRADSLVYTFVSTIWDGVFILLSIPNFVYIFPNLVDRKVVIFSKIIMYGIALSLS